MKHLKPVSKASTTSPAQIITIIIGLLTAIAPIITLIVNKESQQA